MGTIIHYRIPALTGDGSTAHPLHIRVMPSPRGLDLVHADESLSPLALDEEDEHADGQQRPDEHN